MILVTGAGGFIGSNIAKALQDKYDVIALTMRGGQQNLEGFAGKVVEGDITDASIFGTLRNVDVVFHLAAITDTSINDDAKMFSVNVDGFRNVLGFAEKNGAKLIYASSAGVYGNGPVPMRETQAPQPLNAYARSKLEDEKIAMQSNIVAIGLRYFNVFGPAEESKGKPASMIIQLARQMLAGKRPRLFANGEQKRDHIYVKDVVNATVAATHLEKSDVLNVGTGVATSFRGVVNILNDVLGTSFEPEYMENPYTKSYQINTQADITKARRLLGFSPRFTVKGGTVDYFKELGIL